MLKRLKGWWACKHGRHDWVEDKATLVAEELMQGDSVYRLTMGGRPEVCSRCEKRRRGPDGITVNAKVYFREHWATR
jgi:hypothetical protein